MMYIRSLLLITALLCAPLTAFAELLNINAADPEQLAEQMVGIGPSKAMAIIEYRGNHGPFRSIDDLTNVKGIGARTIEQNREKITALPVKQKR